jgi:hypothetical protein
MVLETAKFKIKGSAADRGLSCCVKPWWKVEGKREPEEPKLI